MDRIFGIRTAIVTTIFISDYLRFYRLHREAFTRGSHLPITSPTGIPLRHTNAIAHAPIRDTSVGVKYRQTVGVIAALTPVTNPTSTTMFKALIAMKTRNPVIFAFHPGTQRSSAAAVRAGAPEHCIQWVERPSIDATNLLMRHPGVNLILATGGA
ncbi:aldehyde dehydrogenase family protein, partial [Heliomicrobium gestii]|uniref:aldehyde dehydrogenase family protein n=1 Tax=Heliomicrobium gestii TaxID=2699 RepID=UPI002E294ECC